MLFIPFTNGRLTKCFRNNSQPPSCYSSSYYRFDDHFLVRYSSSSESVSLLPRGDSAPGDGQDGGGRSPVQTDGAQAKGDTSGGGGGEAATRGDDAAEVGSGQG